MTFLCVVLGASGILLGLVSGSVHASDPVSPSPVPVSTESPIPAPKADEQLSSSEGQQLLKNFDRAQSSVLGSLKHRQKVELDELKANQRHRRKEWEQAEREKRRAFFESNTAGRDRRVYVKDFIERRRVFRQLLKEELANRKREHSVRRKALVADLSEKRKQFRSALKEKRRPDPGLWPQEAH